MHIPRSAPWPIEMPSQYSVEIPVWKRVLDVLCVLAAAPLLVPLMAAVALVIRIGSPGPVLFRQTRVGHLGRRFTCFKFRTMHVGASSNGHQAHLANLIRSNAPMVKMDLHHSSSLIPGGWVLRATGLDELPQLINVLRGEMSLVGPRPCIPYEAEQFLPWQRERFNTLPGLTGLWQISGKNRTTFTEMMLLDIQYARTKTLWMDVSIMARTFGALFVQFQDTRNSRSTAAQPASVDSRHPDVAKQPVAA